MQISFTSYLALKQGNTNNLLEFPTINVNNITEVLCRKDFIKKLMYAITFHTSGTLTLFRLVRRRADCISKDVEHL